MKRITSLLLSLLSFSAAQAAAPVNDSITKAISVVAPYHFLTSPDVSTATASTMDPLNQGASLGKTIWYRLPMGPEGVLQTWHITLKSLGGAGTACIYLPNDVDNIAGSLLQSTPLSPITSGQSVVLEAQSLWASTYLMIAGTGRYEITCRLDAGFDFPATAIDLGTGSHITFSTLNHNSTVSADEPALALPVSNTIWFKWTPNFTGGAILDTNFSFVGSDAGNNSFNQTVHDTVLAVYTGQPGSLTMLNQDDDSGWKTNSLLSFSAVSGTTYYISVSTKAGTPPGYISLSYYAATTAGRVAFAGTVRDAVAETSPTKPITLRRYFAAGVGATVTLATVAGGTATGGVDHGNLSTTATFSNVGDASWETSVNLNIADDSSNEGTETVMLQLSNPSALLSISNPSTGFSIIDNDSPEESPDAQPYFLQNQVVRVREGDGYAYNVLFRKANTGNGFYPVQTAKSGTAQRDADFDFVGDYFSGQNQQVALRTSIYDDDRFESEETVLVEVSVPLGGPLTYTLIIEDDDTFVPLAGKLLAPFDYGNRRGQLFATISGNGAVSAKVMLVGQTLALKGQLDAHGKVSFPIQPISRVGAPGFVLTLQATDETGGYDIVVTDGFWKASFTHSAVLQNYAAVTNPCPEAARYTFHLAGTSDVYNSGSGAILVGVTGIATVTGRMFDGTPFTCAGYVDGDGQMSAMAGLYGNKGHVGMIAKLPLVANSTAQIFTRITRPARYGVANQMTAKRYDADGFSGVVCRYSPPAAGQRALESWSTGTGTARLDGALLASMITKSITVSASNVVTAPADAEKLKIKLIPRSGLFTGSFLPPGTSKVLPIYGALIDLPGTNGYGRGHFFDGKEAGYLSISQP